MLTHLGTLPTGDFLRDYWQRKPLLIRQCFPGFVCPFDEHDLAGLALEEAVESRLVYASRHGRPWQLERGPFREKTLRKLPPEGWSLLIQGLEQWLPEMADLLDAFRFLPGWRLDDIMASFAPPGGSVGPHYDHYDVFLIQARGRRRWLVGPRCDHHSPRVADTPLRILDGFPVENEWILEPGDVLYLPPTVAHHGIAIDGCITLSVGFRSPTLAEMISALADDWVARVDGPALERDYAERLQPSGLLAPELLGDVRAAVSRLLDDDAAMHDWLGRFLSQPKSETLVQAPSPDDWPGDDALLERLADPACEVRWNDGSRFLYRLEQAGTLPEDATHLADTLPEPDARPAAGIILYVDGESHPLPADTLAFVEGLCRGNRPAAGFPAPWVRQPAIRSLLVSLFRDGHLTFAEAS